LITRRIPLSIALTSATHITFSSTTISSSHGRFRAVITQLGELFIHFRISEGLAGTVVE